MAPIKLLGTAHAYAALGLLFVNVSIGGTRTHFAARPVLAVPDLGRKLGRPTLTHSFFNLFGLQFAHARQEPLSQERCVSCA